jgi:hypothetical protein
MATPAAAPTAAPVAKKAAAASLFGVDDNPFSKPMATPAAAPTAAPVAKKAAASSLFGDDDNPFSKPMATPAAAPTAAPVAKKAAASSLFDDGSYDNLFGSKLNTKAAGTGGDAGLAHRMVDADILEDGGLRSPLAGMFPPDLPQASLETAMAFCAASVPAVMSSIRIALKKAKKLEKIYPLLSVDERAAVVLYTIEVFPQVESVSTYQYICY